MVNTSADAPLHPVSSINSHIWLRDMASGERTEILNAAKLEWIWTAEIGTLSVELIDDGTEIDRTRFYGLYIDLENGQTLGPFYFNDLEYQEAEDEDSLNRVLWSMTGPFMDKRAKMRSA